MQVPHPHNPWLEALRDFGVIAAADLAAMGAHEAIAKKYTQLPTFQPMAKEANLAVTKGLRGLAARDAAYTRNISHMPSSKGSRVITKTAGVAEDQARTNQFIHDKDHAKLRWLTPEASTAIQSAATAGAAYAATKGLAHMIPSAGAAAPWLAGAAGLYSATDYGKKVSAHESRVNKTMAAIIRDQARQTSERIKQAQEHRDPNYVRAGAVGAGTGAVLGGAGGAILGARIGWDAGDIKWGLSDSSKKSMARDAADGIGMMAKGAWKGAKMGGAVGAVGLAAIGAKKFIDGERQRTKQANIMEELAEEGFNHTVNHKLFHRDHPKNKYLQKVAEWNRDGAFMGGAAGLVTGDLLHDSIHEGTQLFSKKNGAYMLGGALAGTVLGGLYPREKKASLGWLGRSAVQATRGAAGAVSSTSTRAKNLWDKSTKIEKGIVAGTALTVAAGTAMGRGGNNSNQIKQASIVDSVLHTGHGLLNFTGDALGHLSGGHIQKYVAKNAGKTTQTELDLLHKMDDDALLKEFHPDSKHHAELVDLIQKRKAARALAGGAAGYGIYNKVTGAPNGTVH